jgi:hypothetical protein
MTGLNKGAISLNLGTVLSRTNGGRRGEIRGQLRRTGFLSVRRPVQPHNPAHRREICLTRTFRDLMKSQENLWQQEQLQWQP